MSRIPKSTNIQDDFSRHMKLLQRALTFSIHLLPFPVRRAIKHLPVVAPLQRWVVGNCLDGLRFVHRISAGPASGLVYPVVLPQDKQIWTGTYESAFAESLCAEIAPGAVCYDVGGHRGFFSGMMAVSGASEVHTFEPFPANCEQIRRMIGLNPTCAITLHDVALSDEVGRCSFLVMPESSMGKLESSTFESGDLPQGQVEVRMTTIDELISAGELKPAGVVKIDVEGAEMMVLRGAKTLLLAHHPALFIEVHSRELCRETFAFLRTVGYDATVLETGKPPDFVSEPSLCHLHAFRMDTGARELQ